MLRASCHPRGCQGRDRSKKFLIQGLTCGGMFDSVCALSKAQFPSGLGRPDVGPLAGGCVSGRATHYEALGSLVFRVFGPVALADNRDAQTCRRT